MTDQDFTLAKKKNIIYYFHCIIMIIIMFGFGYLPAIEPLPLLGMQVMGIFIGLLYGWTFIDLIWPSLLGLIALGFTEYAPMKKVFMEGFGDDLVILVFFMFVFSAYLSRIGLTQVIANWFISRKIAIGRPWVFSLMILLTAYVLGAVMSLTATIIIIWSIFYKICDNLGFKQGDKYPMLMLIGVVYAAMLGYAIFPFKVLQALVLSSIMAHTDLSVNFLAFTASTFLITIVSLFAYLGLCKYIFKPDVSLLTSGIDHFADLREHKLNHEQKLGCFSLILFLAMAILPSILPPSPLASILKTLGMTGSIVLITIGLVLLRKKDGTSAFNFNIMANSNISWDVLILFAATMPVSHAMSMPESGVMDLIVLYLSPIFTGMHPLLFIVLFVTLAALITQVAHNLVLAAVITPIMCRFALELGVNPLLVGVLTAYTLAIAVATPGASTPGALTYANRAWISSKEAYTHTFIIFVMNTIITLVVGIPIVSLFF